MSTIHTLYTNDNINNLLQSDDVKVGDIIEIDAQNQQDSSRWKVVLNDKGEKFIKPYSYIGGKRGIRKARATRKTRAKRIRKARATRKAKRTRKARASREAKRTRKARHSRRK